MSITIIRERAALAQSGLTKSTMHRRIQAGLFMKPVPISERCVGWIAEHLEQYNKLIARGASEDEIRAFVESVSLPARPKQRPKSKPLPVKRIRVSLQRVRVEDSRTVDKRLRVKVEQVPAKRIRLSVQRVRV
jgi:prophage regulatory protein